MIRVFVADDHEVVRQGVRRFLDATPDLRVAGEASDGTSTLTAVASLEMDVLLLDLSLPGVSGRDVLRQTKTLRPDLPVVVLSMYPEEQFAPRLRSEGAAAYLSKERPLREVVDVIRSVVSGTAVGRAQEQPAGSVPPHQTLSPREYQVFTLLVQGRSNGEIAVELNLAPSTVSNTIARIRTKLNVRNVNEIVGYALRAGLFV